MNIIPVGQNNNLFKITNVFSQDLIDYCKECDWDNLPSRPQSQNVITRKIIEHKKINQFLMIDIVGIESAYKIEEKLNLKFEDANIVNVNLWYDSSGYYSQIHRDFDYNEYKLNNKYNIPMSLQVYLTDGPYNLGTIFYYDKEKTKLKYAFPYEANTGYLMLNDFDQWHEMITPIPKNFARISCWFGFSQYKRND
jgi:hypothetical protein